jgi:hypothetical protein
VLVVIHEYLLCINHDERSSNDELGIRVTKSFIFELVKVKGSLVWNHYGLVEKHWKEDNYIKRWITVILDLPAQQKEQQVPSFG